MKSSTAASRGSDARSARGRAVRPVAERAFASRHAGFVGLVGLAACLLTGALAAQAAPASDRTQAVARTGFSSGTSTAAVLAQHALEGARLARVAEILRAEPRDALETALVLSGLGRESGAALLELLRQGELPALGAQPSVPLEGARRRAILMAFELMPREELLRSLELRAERTARTGWLECALLVLAQAGLAQDYDLALELARAPAPDPESVAASLRDCLIALHRRQPASIGRVAARVGGGPPELDAALLQALGRSDLESAGSALVRSLGHSTQLDTIALDELGAWGQRGSRALDAQDAQRVRDELQAPHAPARRAALLALALLDDVASVPEIAVQLEAADATTRTNAHWALERLTGLRLRKDARGWNAWIAREQAWWDAQGEGTLDDLRSGEPGRVARAINALAGRRLLRAEFEADLIELLYASSTELVELAAATLSTLGARRALPTLVELLVDDEERIAQAAWRALLSISGRKLPLDRAVWLEALGSDRPSAQSAEPSVETSARELPRADGG